MPSRRLNLKPRSAALTGRSARVFTICALLLAVGCGVGTYEQRLTVSSNYFTYLNKLNASLARAPWVAPDPYGMSMRTPLGFQLLARPVPPEEAEAAAEGEAAAASESESATEETEASADETAASDPRHPSFLGIELPGLIDAWQADLPTSGGGTTKAFLYVMGNHDRFLELARNDNVGLDPETFLDDLEAILADSLRVTVAEESGSGAAVDNARYKDLIPRGEEYAVPKEFSKISYVPAEERLTELGLPSIRLHLYEHRAGPVQVAILMIHPASVSSRPEEALRLGLETFSVVDQPPALKRADAAPSGGVKDF